MRERYSAGVCKQLKCKSRSDSTTDILVARFAVEVGRQEVFRIGTFKKSIACGCGVVLAAVEGDAGEVLEAATFDAAVFGTIAKDDVASAENACVAVGIVEGIRIA